MSLSRYEPWSLLTNLHTDLNDLFDGRLSENKRTAVTQWTPAIDLKEEANQFIIHADLPGVRLDDIEITMENSVLTLKGHRETESKVEEKNYYRIERISGAFHRRFSLPDTADSEDIKAEYKNGVLTIVIPKKEKAKPKKIAVKS